MFCTPDREAKINPREYGQYEVYNIRHKRHKKNIKLAGGRWFDPRLTLFGVTS